MHKPFSLTSPPAPKPPKPRLDVDYEQMALSKWLEVQVASHDLDAAWDESAELGKRLLKGDVWLRTHDEDHPQYQRAVELRNGLHEEQRALLVTIRMRYVQTRILCGDLYVLLGYVDDVAAWLVTHAPAIQEHSIRAIWDAVQPHRAPPFDDHPPPDSAWYIEAGITTQAQLEEWMQRKASAA